MKFSQFTYTRPDMDEVQRQYEQAISKLAGAQEYAQARAAFLEKDALSRRVQTQATLCSIRHSIDTTDAFYDQESDFWNAALPEIEEWEQGWTKALLDSPFRAEFAAEYGELMFLNGEIALKSFAPEIIPEMKQENELTLRYEKLLASAQIPFEDGVYTLSQLTPFKSDPEDARRLGAWQAEGRWYREHQQELDEIYDELVHLRDGMGKKLGYESYIPLGYYRMGRNCYTQQDVERFRAAVVEDVVPLADELFRRQAQRLGVAYPLSFADAALEFRSGNPKPSGTAEEILQAGERFYNALSPETGAFFRMMRERELMDVLSTKGKQSGGYCTQLWDERVPFIFANFNGTQGDVEVVTHEAGHAFAFYMNRDRVPCEYAWPTMEACEVHSMSMEFFAEQFAQDFFGADARKFRYSHLSGALTFLPYGTMVDHFQHIVYEHPDYTPAQRHGEWKRLLGIYMPWLRLDGEIPFYADGEGWQRQHHIYSSPFYYIDYCLAQTVALQFWGLLQESPAQAWEHYMAYTRQGGSRTFTRMLEQAGLESPFREHCLHQVCTQAKAYLERFDLSQIS